MLNGNPWVWGSVILGSILTLVLGNVLKLLYGVPSSIPWISKDQRFVSKLGACLRQFSWGTVAFSDLKDGQLQHGLNGHPFVTPSTNFVPQVILPEEYVQWMVKQPENIVSHALPPLEKFAIKQLLPQFQTQESIKFYPATINTLYTTPQRNFKYYQSSLLDEIGRGIDATFGEDTTKWKSVNLAWAMQNLSRQMTFRALMGESLTNNKRFTKVLIAFLWCFGISSVVVGGYTPPILIPVVGWIWSFPLNFLLNRCLEYLEPVLAERWDLLQKSQDNPDLSNELPNDFITSIVKSATSAKYERIGSPRLLAGHLLAVTIASESLTIAGSNVLLDLYSENPDILEQIQQEAAEAFKSSGPSDPEFLTKMVYIDSTIRETMRLNPITIPYPAGKIVAPDGLKLPNGIHLPKSTILGSPTFAIHRNPAVYHSPSEYQPFRFVGKEKNENKVNLTTINENFITFGQGSHVCPGRYLGAAHLKIMLAYIVHHYDVQKLAYRPESVRISDTNMPPMSAKIQVRRKSK